MPAVAVNAALVHRMKTGESTKIDIAMFDSLLPWCAHTASAAIAGGPAPLSGEQRSLGGAAFKVENPNAASGCGCGTSFAV